MAGTEPNWSHCTTFQATPISASEARDFVMHHLVDYRLLYLVDPIRLVVSELTTNALVHGPGAAIRWSWTGNRQRAESRLGGHH